MNKKGVSIATITWARDEEEEQLLRISLQQLATLEVPVYITDGGSNAAFLENLHSFPHFTLVPATEQGLWAQAKNSLLAAYRSGTPFIFYTEPDKFNFFHYGLSQMLAAIQTDEQSGIVLAARSAVGMATFPPFQQMTETTINNCCTEVTGHRVDYSYGPFLLNRQLVPYLIQMQEDIGWGWRPYTFGMAHRLGYRIEAYMDDFSCPLQQRTDSPKERIYRMRQLSQSIHGLVLSTQTEVDKERLFQLING